TRCAQEGGGAVAR
ncbi:hypothetical protein BN1708_019166, partial [Verticillium longisporum]